jgi:hypothetical protein
VAVNNEAERMWKEAIAYFGIFHHWLGGTEEIHRKP